MRSIIITLILFLSSIVCIAQDEIIKKKVDSLSNASRIKADLVLSHFDNIKAIKILYSISDERYYVIFKDGCCYKEYYIHTDSGGIVKDKRLVKNSKRDRKFLSRKFELSNYHKEFVTNVDNPTVVQGKHSYFVLKDVNGKSYGEYWLSVITVPIPIDKKLYNYLLTKLLNESTKNVKAP